MASEVGRDERGQKIGQQPSKLWVMATDGKRGWAV